MKLKNIILSTSIVLVPFLADAQTKPSATVKKVSSPTKSAVKPAVVAVNKPAVALTSLKDSASYSLGILVAQNFKMQNIDINVDLLQKACSEVLNGTSTLISDIQANQVLQKYLQKEQSKQFEPNRIAGEKFLAENKKKEGVITLPSGLQYSIIKKGDGPIPKASDKVKTHYHGTLIDGTVFDSSVQRGEPISFPVTGVIPGWVEALQLMPVGSKWKLFIPYELAYGTRGSGGAIKPYSTLVFEVELLGIEQ